MSRIRLLSLLTVLVVAPACADDVSGSPWALEELSEAQTGGEGGEGGPGGGEVGGDPAPDLGAPDGEVPDADGSDAGTPDAGTPDGGTPDGGTLDGGTPDGEPPSPAACLPSDEAIDTGGTCNPVLQDCGPAAFHCELVMGSEPHPFPTCVPTEPDKIVGEGEACGIGEQKCAPGLFCRGGKACRRTCQTTTGAGCEPGESCRPLFPGAPWGTCDFTCQIFD